MILFKVVSNVAGSYLTFLRNQLGPLFTQEAGLHEIIDDITLAITH